MSKGFQFLGTALLICILMSCVSKDKYNELMQVKDHLEQENSGLRELENTARDLRSKNHQTQSELDKVRAEYADLQASFNSLDRNYKDLARRYDKLISDNRKISTVTADEKRLLEEELANKQLELEQKQRQLQFLEAGLSQREQKVEELTRLLQAKDAQMNAIRDRINAALRGFTSEDLSVTERDGKIYVSLSQNLLFKSGSAYINSKGKKALKQVADVLKTNNDIDINVEGHTDTDGDANSNWDLSVRRATSVVKQLTVAGLNPQRVVASGRGQHKPIATNSTSKGKAQNRRTEIILSPKLEALYDLINVQN